MQDFFMNCNPLHGQQGKIKGNKLLSARGFLKILIKFPRKRLIKLNANSQNLVQQSAGCISE